MKEPPAGFELLKPLDEIMEFVGPIYWKNEDRSCVLGAFVNPRHCNPRNNCHGGVLATFADLALGMNASLDSGKGGPTISLTIDYMQPALAGAWIEAHCSILHRAPKTSFVQCLVTADGVPVLRASGTFRQKWTQLEYRSMP